MRAKVRTLHFHVTKEVKVENELEIVDLKLKISFCFIFFFKYSSNFPIVRLRKHKR